MVGNVIVFVVMMDVDVLSYMVIYTWVIVINTGEIRLTS